MTIYKVIEELPLLEYILKYIEPNKKKAKVLLASKTIFVNNKWQTKFNYPLCKNDIIEIKKMIQDEIEIIYEDKNIIVVNKPHGLLTIATEKEQNTLYHIVREYIKKDNKNNKLFVIHRLDKDTSGIIIFAKNEKIKNLYQENWNHIVIKRGYIAIVEGKLPKKSDIISLHLKENKNLKVYVNKDGKLATTSYKVLKENANYSLLDIEIKTGRKNQIRATLEYIKHPIVGDKKYGSNINPIRRLGLHANELIFINPITKEKMEFKTDIPNVFKKII